MDRSVKAGTPSPHVVSPDLPLTSSTSSSSFSSSTVGVTGGGAGGGGGGNTHLGPSSGVALKSVSSQPALTQSTVSISQTPHNSHILNGPHYSSMSTTGPAARDSSTNLTAGGLSLPQKQCYGSHHEYTNTITIPFCWTPGTNSGSSNTNDEGTTYFLQNKTYFLVLLIFPSFIWMIWPEKKSLWF